MCNRTFKTHLIFSGVGASDGIPPYYLVKAWPFDRVANALIRLASEDLLHSVRALIPESERCWIEQYLNNQAGTESQVDDVTMRVAMADMAKHLNIKALDSA